MTHRSPDACQCGKRYYTKGSARFAVTRRNKRDGAKLWNAYRCPYARHLWHIGHIASAVPESREGRREMAARRLIGLGKRPKTKEDPQP